MSRPIGLKESVEQSKVKPGEVYYHYKDHLKLYRILHIAVDEASEELTVVYQAMYGDMLVWVRKLNVFCSMVEFEGKDVKRFRKVGEI